MRLTYRSLIAALLVSAAAFGCDDPSAPATAPSAAASEAGPEEAALLTLDAPAPGPLATVGIAGMDLSFWPYISARLDGTPPRDPVNLVLTGHGDPRNVRNALMSLDGDRPAPFSAFTCTWTDAVGAMQATYADPGGWAGSVIQLECGAYSTFRFHVRLFAAGPVTLANAHVEVLIPGTTDHQVLSWEAAEQFIAFELARGGLLGAAPAQTGPINDSPTLRSIPAIIYNGLPPEVRSFTGGPLTGTVSEPVGIPNDGSATVLTLGASVPSAGGTTQSFTVPFGQIIPKPFCAGSGELVRVDGPVLLTQVVKLSDDGKLDSHTFARGDLTVRSFDPSTGELGEGSRARIRDQYMTRIGDGDDVVRSTRHQLLLTSDGSAEQLMVHLQVGPHDHTRSSSEEICG